MMIKGGSCHLVWLFQSSRLLFLWGFLYICGWRPSDAFEWKVFVTSVRIADLHLIRMPHKYVWKLTSCRMVVLYHGPWTFFPETITFTSTISDTFSTESDRLENRRGEAYLPVDVVKLSAPRIATNAMKSANSDDCMIDVWIQLQLCDIGRLLQQFLARYAGYVQMKCGREYLCDGDGTLMKTAATVALRTALLDVTRLLRMMIWILAHDTLYIIRAHYTVTLYCHLNNWEILDI